MRTASRMAGWMSAWVLVSGAALAAPPMQIQFAEPVELPAAAGHAQFDAYGRRFSLTLESNDRLLRSIAAARKQDIGQTRVLRGTVDGVQGSWVRLTRVGGDLQGAIWDGADVYVVTSYRSIANKLTTPISAASPDQTVVYRLSDTLNGLPAEFCGLVPDADAAEPAGSGLQQYKSLVDDLRLSAIGNGTIEQLDISLIADRAFQTAMGANAEAEMIARLNIVDGIFGEQVGVILSPTEFRLVPAGADPFTSTFATMLLDQVAAFREATPAVRSAGLAHLMTGKNLEGDTLGIAYVDSLCRAREGVSLSNSEVGSFLSALVMAHEIGHNFGARHDGVDGVCRTTPTTFLMSPTLNDSTQFSACSLNSMAASIASARGVCIGSANYVDLALTVPPSPYVAQTNGTFSLPLTVRSQGTLVATNVQLQLRFPPWFPISGATLSGATCTVSANVIRCALSDFAVGEERALNLQITGNSTGSIYIEVALSANRDFITSNNQGVVQVGVESGVDLGVTATPSATNIFVTDPVDYRVDLTANGSLPAQGASAQIHLGGIPIESFNDGPHTCAIVPSQNWVLLCQLADILPGTTSRITVRGRADQARIAYGGVTTSQQNDSNPTNNTATFTVSVNKQQEVRTSVSAEELRAVIGTSYQLTYTLTTLGRTPATNVRFQLNQPPMGVLESVSTTVACVTTPDSATCNFGTLSPGNTRTIVVRFRMTGSATSYLNGSTNWGNATGDEYSSVLTRVYANLTIDVAAEVGSVFPFDVGETVRTGFNVETRGVDPAQGVVSTLELSPTLRLVAIAPDPFTVPGWTCVILTPQRGRCTGGFPGGTAPANGRVNIGFSFVADEVGEWTATHSVTATNDGDPTNNSAQMSLTARPFLDVALAGPDQPRNLITGTTTTIDATLTTGRYPVPAVRVMPWAANAALALDSFSVGGVPVDCSATTSGSTCLLGDLPANSSLPVRAVFRAVSGDAVTYGTLEVSTPRDSNTANDRVVVQMFTMDRVDIVLSAAQPSVTSVNGTTLNLPLITVSNGATTSRDIVVEIPLPTFATIASISSFGMCSGTTTIQCSFAAVPPNDTRTIAIALNSTAVGTFTSNVTMQAFNDSTANNNAVPIAITVNASTPTDGGGNPGGGGGGSSGGGGGGGGGRLEWLALALLALLAGRRGLKAKGG